MNFQEAMIKLAEGKKVSRPEWKGTYLQKLNDSVHAFEVSITHYMYNHDTLLSDGWILIDEHGFEMWDNKFRDVIPHLQSGLTARLFDWSHDCYISWDKLDNSIVYYSVRNTSIVPNFASLIAEDWIEL